MDEEAEILVDWVDFPESDIGDYIPGILRTHPNVKRVSAIAPSDVVPPDPNQYVARVVADTAVMDAIEADPDYPILEGTRSGAQAAGLDDVPSQDEFNAFRRQLRPRMNSRQIGRILGDTVNGRTWRRINGDIVIGCNRSQAKLAVSTYTMQALQLAGEYRGYDADEEIGRVSDAGYRDLVISRVAIGHGSAAGIVSLKLSGSTRNEPLPQNYFHILDIARTPLSSSNAVYADNEWVWTNTTVTAGVDETISFGIVLRQPEAQVFTLNAQRWDNKTGFRHTGGIGDLTPDKFRRAPIAAMYTRPALGGVFVFDLDLNTIPLPQNLFTSIDVNGTHLPTAAASYDQDTQRWVWTETGFEFEDGQTYEVTIQR